MAQIIDPNIPKAVYGAPLVGVSSTFDLSKKKLIGSGASAFTAIRPSAAPSRSLVNREIQIRPTVQPMDTSGAAPQIQTQAAASSHSSLLTSPAVSLRLPVEVRPGIQRIQERAADGPPLTVTIFPPFPYPDQRQQLPVSRMPSARVMTTEMTAPLSNLQFVHSLLQQSPVRPVTYMPPVQVAASSQPMVSVYAFPFAAFSGQPAVAPQTQSVANLYSSANVPSFPSSLLAPSQPLSANASANGSDISLSRYQQLYTNGLPFDYLALIGLQLFGFLKNINVDGRIRVSVSPNTILLNDTSGISVINGKARCTSTSTGISITAAPYLIEESSRSYWAPEVILGQPSSQQSSWWSAGIVLFELFTNAPLIPACNHTQHILEAQLLIDPVPSFYSRDSFMTETIMKHAASRRENETVCATFIHLLQCLLKRDPKLRMDPAKVLRHPFFQLAVNSQVA